MTTESVAITNFSLTADIKIMKNLDSVFFSIDLEHGVVFNADSLPRGTNVTKLVPKISYPSTVTSAVLEMAGGTHREGTVDYHTNSSDTIDFTGDVTLTLKAGENISKVYYLKVNVHKEDPDTVYWDHLGSMALPSRLPNPKAQKTVAYGKGVLCLIQENDGTFTSSISADVFAGSWNKNAVSFPAAPVVPSLTSDGSRLYVLDNNGDLLSSEDGTSWQTVSNGWKQIIGMYGDAVVGIKGFQMISYPDGAVPSLTMPDEFPVSGYSNPIVFSNRWSTDSTIVIFGGVTSSGKVSSASWAFDGSQWVDIADRQLPPLEGLSVVDYYSYLNSASNGLLKEFEAYLAFGGRDAFGNVNDKVYITYDNGINWQLAQAYMQLPENVEAGYMVDAITLGTSMQSNLSDRWSVKRRLPFNIDGDVISWECPYIFLFGGYGADMISLNSRIRSGVLQRLTFAPLF